jgi:hypothetical protein
MERRAAPRHSVLKAGTILIGDGSINCMARDMSETGAMLGVTSSVDIPEYFTLILSGSVESIRAPAVVFAVIDVVPHLAARETHRRS